MSIYAKSVRVFIISVLFVCPGLFAYIKTTSPKGVFVTKPDIEIGMSGDLRIEEFYGKNISLLNSNNRADKVWYARHIFDISIDSLYGRETYGTPVVEFLFTLRNRAIWGNPSSNALTTESTVKVENSVFGSHRHNLPRHFLWMREIWMSFDMTRALCLPFDSKHELTLGAFSFELGRGIALGDAFAVGTEILGFYTDDAIDQYAFGVNLAGDIVKDCLSYSAYFAILQNKSDRFASNAEKIYGQEFNRLKTPERGFGSINFVIAAKFPWKVFDGSLGRLDLEPYALFAYDPEQKIEFTADATSKLGTIGCAGEFSSDCFEAGFDYALNLGQQRVRGWDRNQIRLGKNDDGLLAEFNSHVIGTIESQGVVSNIPYIEGSSAQTIINDSFREELLNGTEIGRVDKIGFLDGNGEDIILSNSENRFRNPYTNKFEGWMFVFDAGYWIIKDQLQFASTVGVASGDDNPNLETQDGSYRGFISLQELYSGKRVRSAFLLGGAGKLRRPLSQPKTNRVPTRFRNASLSRFTNLVFCGSSLRWMPVCYDKSIKINPNILVYWEENPIGRVAEENRLRRASSFLGVELNTFAYYSIFKNVDVFCVASIFFPGSHYTDRMGTPIPNRQATFLDRQDTTGFNDDRVPDLGNDIAFTLNIGVKYSF